VPSAVSGRRCVKSDGPRDPTRTSLRVLEPIVWGRVDELASAASSTFTEIYERVLVGPSVQKPDFSGTWTLDPASAQAAGGGGGGGAPGNGSATVKQTADALTIERTMGDARVTLTYKLDGTESRNTFVVRGGQSADSISTASWDGPKLTIVTKTEMDGQVRESTQVWTLEGSTLTVETTSARGTQTRVYKK
jgi:hypothetical protein